MSALPLPAPQPLTDVELIGALAQRYPFLFRAKDDPRDQRTLGDVAPLYLKDAPAQIGARCLEEREFILRRLCKSFGSRALGTLTPFELKVWIQERWPGSSYTRARVNAAVQRVMNWAVTMRLIRENPFAGVSFAHEPKRTGRDIQPDELQALLRAADPYFRRFLLALKFTGARPGELRALEWRHIDWQRGIATLEEHKTAKKTGKPRTIVFPPGGMKLLAWIKRNEHGPSAVELRRILEAAGGKAAVRDVAAKMHAKGYSYRAAYRARQALGVRYQRTVGGGSGGVYVLPAGIPVPDGAAGRFVFLNHCRRPWTRSALGTKFGRLRKRLGLSASCKLYGLRHAFVTEGVRRGTNLTGLATLVGHRTTRMIEQVYCHLDSDLPFLHAAALQALGQKPADGPVEQPAEQAADGAAVLIERLVQQITALEEKVRQHKPKPPPPRTKIQARHRVIHEAVRWAISQNPALANATDRQLCRWLQGRDEYAGQLPPTPESFRRTLIEARRLIDGAGKRAQRRLCDPFTRSAKNATLDKPGEARSNAAGRGGMSEGPRA